MLDRVTNITYRTSGGSTVGAFAYAYDADGLVTQKVEVGLGGAAVTHAYGYDGIGRLVAADGVAYTYDLAGNRLSRSGAGVPPAAYSYSHNRLDGDLYDAAGCVTNMFRNGVELSLSWNTQGQLVSVSTNNAFAESYVYDALGRRVSTTDKGGTVYHVYDGHQCAADVDGSGRPLRTYAWGPGIDNLLAMTVYSYQPNSPQPTASSFFAVKDHLGSVHALVDAQGEIAQTFTYDAWGNACVSTPNSSFLTPDFSCRYLFQGREYSAATGLYNFRARWYDPVSGRWLSKDPIGLEGGLNLYAFCGDDPVNWRDPWGLEAQNDEKKTNNVPPIEIGGGVNPPKDWPRPGGKWKWDKGSGRYRKGEKYRKWHDGHGPGHWDEEDRDGSNHENIYPNDPRFLIPFGVGLGAGLGGGAALMPSTPFPRGSGGGGGQLLSPSYLY